MIRPSALALVASLALAGCATLPAERAGQAERGRGVAQAACAQCHGLDDEPSPWRDAPPFRAMSLRPNAILYERRVAELTGRHVGMPPMEVSDEDLRDLAAYMRRLQHETRRRR